jgi:MoxR-like ATPase
LLLDAELFCWTTADNDVTAIVSELPPAIPSLAPPSLRAPSPVPKSAERSQLRTLPPTLRAHGERALAYLHAGMHVVFAGPPGTGKTTLAQFVGHAWDQGRRDLPLEMLTSSAPLTTVGSSAWSPFHTIGGLLPSASGHGFQLKAGLFIAPESQERAVWSLRNGALVLDEMNRADLDRCIGELYPLLSGSVDSVVPGGLLGVEAIVLSERFRVLATVNDLSVDDIVFPISEGLARRFQRIEIGGASKEDVLAFLGAPGEGEAGSRMRAAVEAIEELFVAAREEQAWRGADERLPVGAAYFGLLHAWVQGTLRLDTEKVRTEAEQAVELVSAGCQSLKRLALWTKVLAKLDD